MIIKYGIADNNIDVTSICNSKLKCDNLIIIQSGDIYRAKYFTDPLPNVLKSIFIMDKDGITEYDHTKTIYINTDTNTVSLRRLQEETKILKMEEELKVIHNNLKIKHGSFQAELPEQKMSKLYLTGKEKILEIGGNIGRNSMVISHILGQNNNLVVLESDLEISKKLEENRNLNNMNFHIENSALSKRNLIQKGWNTIVSDTLLNGYKTVKTITYDEVMKKYNIEFDTLVLDCEGAFYYILQDMPEILNNVNLIIMENDYTNINHKKYVDKILKNNNFYVDYVEAGGWLKISNNFYEVWKKYDYYNLSLEISNNKKIIESITFNKKYVDIIYYFLESELSPKRKYPISIGLNHTGLNYIYYNSEQLSVPTKLNNCLENIRKSPPLEIWDYSIANIEILKKYDIIAKYVPIKFPKWYIDTIKILKKTPEYDVGFCGTLSEYRLNILNKLKQNNISLNFIQKFGIERDIELSKCKIILNVHYNKSYKIFESSRCGPWLEAGYTVISENSLDNDSRCINVEYDKILDKIIESLNVSRI